ARMCRQGARARARNPAGDHADRENDEGSREGIDIWLEPRGIRRSTDGPGHSDAQLLAVALDDGAHLADRTRVQPGDAEIAPSADRPQGWADRRRSADHVEGDGVDGSGRWAARTGRRHGEG